jgi:tetratricopeptide (TPR) repeat protein
MKKVITLIFTAITIMGSYVAQDCTEISQPNFGSDSAQIKNCRQNLSLYSEYLKQKNYTDAAKFWTITQSFCPKYKQNLYANGTYIYKKIAQQKAKEKSPEKQLYIDSVYAIYDMWEANFGSCYKIDMKKAAFIMSLDASKNFSLAYSLYEGVFSNDPDITSYSDVKYFTYAIKYMYKTSKIDCDKFLELYEMLSGVCDANIANGKKVEKYKNVQAFVDKEVSPCASCDKLEEIYAKKVAENPQDMELTRKVFGMLSAKKCTDSDFYLQLLDKVLNDPNNPPTDKDLINAALADHKRGDYTKAKERFKRALAISEDDQNKQKCYTMLYDIALKRKAYKEAYSLTSSMTDNCIAYERKARTVAASANDCGTSALERSLVYCLALDYAEKACGKVGSATLNAWKGSLLPKKDLIMLDVVNGSEHQVSCWNTKVKLRTRD